MNRVAVAKELVRLARELVSMEFPTDAALKKYLREHPDADRSLHRVVKKEPTNNVDELSHRVHYGLGDSESHTREKMNHAKETLSHLSPEERKNVKSKIVKHLDSVDRDAKTLIDKYRRKNPDVIDIASLKKHLDNTDGDEENEDNGKLDALNEMRKRYQSLHDGLAWTSHKYVEP